MDEYFDFCWGHWFSCLVTSPPSKNKIDTTTERIKAGLSLHHFGVCHLSYFECLLGVALKFLPKAWQFDNTSNQKALLVLFQDKSWLPFVFIVLVILTPITEELLFRHIIIGELGKKFGIWVMGAFSIFIFTFLHVKSATSPFEAAPYLLMSCLFVIMYIRSRCNIAVSIALHMLVNGFSFLAIVMQSI